MKIFDDGLDDLMSNIEEQVYWKFRDAEEIGSSDISCCVRDILGCYYRDPNYATAREFQLVRNYVHSCINELPRKEAA